MKHLSIMCAVILQLTIWPSCASASETSGKIQSLYVRSSDGLIYVTLDAARSGKPPCAAKDYFIVKDEHSDTGKAQLAMLMAAYLGGKSITILGADTCTRWLDGEDIDAVAFGN